MTNILIRHWSFLTAIFILWITISGLFILSTAQNDGHLIYALDDAYIHMAIAKNLVLHGNWGITRYEFSSSSSSILWTLVLSAVYFLFGVNEVTPLILNIVISTVTVFITYLILNKHLSQIYTFFILLGIIFFTPLPALVFGGMEHGLQSLIAIVFAFLSARVLAEEKFSFSRLDAILLLGLTPFVTFTRYEGLFLIFVVCTLFLLRDRFLYFFCICVSAIIPIGIYGAISVAHGWYLLPNSVLVKGRLPNPTSLKQVIAFLGDDNFQKLFTTPHLALLLIVALVLYILRFDKQKGFWQKDQIMIVIFVATSLLHLQFANVGWFFRYEAYLVSLGIFTIAPQLFEYLSLKGPKFNLDKELTPKYLAVLSLALLLTCPLIKRGVDAVIQIPQATTNIYQQQYQMGLFLKHFYQGQVIAANDVGAINYLADIRCFDLVGLGTLEIAKKKGRLYQQEINALAKSKKVEIAVVYEAWFENGHISFDGVPASWAKPVGQWRIKNNVVAADDTVSFYAVNASAKADLIKHLEQFALMLPKGVEAMAQEPPELTIITYNTNQTAPGVILLTPDHTHAQIIDNTGQILYQSELSSYFDLKQQSDGTLSYYEIDTRNGLIRNLDTKLG